MPNQFTGKPKRQIIYPIGPSLAYIPLTKGQYSRIDAEDIERCSTGTWYAIWDNHTKSYYAARNQNGGTLQLHRFLLDAPSGITVDHVNRDTLDNRKSELRFATKREQMRNQKIRSTNKTGFKGVCLDQRSGRYRANIRNDEGKTLWIGLFDTAEEAGEAYRIAAIELHGDFANV